MDNQKPPVLNDEQIDKTWPDKPQKSGLLPAGLPEDVIEAIAREVLIGSRRVAQAQRDDTWQKAQAYYENWYGKLLKDYKRIKAERAELLDRIQQAKAEVAREIFEEIEKQGCIVEACLRIWIPRWVGIKSKYMEGK